MEVTIVGTATLPDVRPATVVHGSYVIRPADSAVLGAGGWAEGAPTLTLPALDAVAEGHEIVIRCDTLPGSVLVTVPDPVHGSDSINGSYFQVRLTQPGQVYRFRACGSVHRWLLDDTTGCDPVAA